LLLESADSCANSEIISGGRGREEARGLSQSFGGIFFIAEKT
jgi:hypothetical protein